MVALAHQARARGLAAAAAAAAAGLCVVALLAVAIPRRQELLGGGRSARALAGLAAAVRHQRQALSAALPPEDAYDASGGTQGELQAPARRHQQEPWWPEGAEPVRLGGIQDTLGGMHIQMPWEHTNGGPQENAAAHTGGWWGARGAGGAPRRGARGAGRQALKDFGVPWASPVEQGYAGAGLSLLPPLPCRARALRMPAPATPPGTGGPGRVCCATTALTPVLCWRATLSGARRAVHSVRVHRGRLGDGGQEKVVHGGALPLCQVLRAAQQLHARQRARCALC